jgi:cytochrome c-type biogenesis protein CcmF
VLSRESSFLFNNLILLASCFAVLWGTLFPVISEAVSGEKISVDAPFFNRVEIPIALGLMLLTGVGPLIAWRRSSLESLQKAFLWPMAAGVGVAALLAILGVHNIYALISFMLCTFVTVTVAIEFIKGAAAIQTKSGTHFISSMIELTHRNTRRYGGYIVHIGMVLIFIGITGKAFDKDTTIEVAPSETIELGRYQLRAGIVQSGQNENYVWQKLPVFVTKDGNDLGTIWPERRVYLASKQPTSEVAIRRRPNEDLYVNFAGMSADNSKAVIQAYVFPLVTWIWAGYWVVLFGTIICLIPSKTRLIYPRTEVVGIAGKYAKVED